MSIQIQAEDFFNAYLVLKENTEALTARLENSPGKPLIGNRELGTRITGSVEIVCLAFSVELYIKDLHFAVNGKTPHGHNIFKLYEGLPEHIQQEILTMIQSVKILSLLEVIFFRPKGLLEPTVLTMGSLSKLKQSVMDLKSGVIPMRVALSITTSPLLWLS